MSQTSGLIWEDFYKRDVMLCYKNELIRNNTKIKNYLVTNSIFTSLSDRVIVFKDDNAIKLLVSGSKFSSITQNNGAGCDIKLV